MLIPTKIQLDQKNHEFIKQVYKDLHYKSLSEYVREAVNAKVRKDRKRIRELKRMAAMQMIGRSQYNNLFELIDGDDFENR
jgi:Arc/MetJ-type ribon-helix-helix transcriptional regulator